jgi:NADH-quinone oxidoreductase subunit N
MLFFAILSSTLYGLFGAYYAKEIREFIGYTSIAHTGFILIGLICADETGGLRAALYYFVYYIFAFTLMLLVFSTVVEKNQPQGIRYINQLELIGTNYPSMLKYILTALFGLAAVPPLPSMWLKYYLLQEFFNSGFYSLTLIILLSQVLNIYLYLRLIKVITLGYRRVI